MGEAKRRRLAGEMPAPTDQMMIPTEAIPDFFKGIAEIVNAFPMPKTISPGIGGFCMIKTIIAYQAVRVSGIDARIGLGGALVRVGFDPKYDVIALMRPTQYRNGPQWGADLPLLGPLPDLIFDATVGRLARS